jgi:TetR/AcrR family transcriptional regulator
MAFIKNPEKIIWDAARKIFLSKGLSGARMQDIADEAGINKALLHYYYRSKEKLFAQIFEKELNGFVHNLESIFTSSLSFFEKIEKLVEHDYETFTQCPELPLFLLNELSQQSNCPFRDTSCMRDNRVHQLFRQLVKDEIEAGNIKEVNPDQLFIHLVSLTIYPFMAKPMMQAMLGFDTDDYNHFMQNRKKEICRFVFDSLAADQKLEHF